MKHSVVAQRYARALYDLLVHQKSEDLILAQLRAVSKILLDDPAFFNFFGSPLSTIENKTSALKAAIQSSNIHQDAQNFLFFLIEKNRFILLPEILAAVQDLADEAHGVCRGYVRSASALEPEERQALEDQLKKVVEKQVIMTYQVDPSLLGGLVAQIGSFTLDDSIVSHLNRLNDQINRSI